MSEHSERRRFSFRLLSSDPYILALFVFFHVLVGLLILLDIVPLSDLHQLSTFSHTEPQVLALVIEAVIYALAFSAFLRAAMLARDMRMETACAEQVEAASSKEARRIRENTVEPILIERVPAFWLGMDGGEHTTVCMCKSLYEEALDRRFNSRPALLRQAGAKIGADISVLHDRQRAALHMGILGTFLGFVFAMPSLVAMSADTFEPAVFGPLFSSLKVCFTTSVAGLVASLVIGAAHSRVIKLSTTLFQRMEAAMDSLMIVLRNASNDRHAAQSYNQVNHALDRVVARLDRQNDRVQLQADAFVEGMERLHVARQALSCSVDGIEEIRNKVLQQLEDISERVNPERMFESISNQLQQTIDGIAASMETGVSSGVRAVCYSTSTLNNATRALERESDAHRSASAVMHKAVTGMSDEIGRSIRAGLSPALEQFAGALDRVCREIECLGRQELSACQKPEESVRASPVCGRRWSLAGLFSRQASKAG